MKQKRKSLPNHVLKKGKFVTSFNDVFGGTLHESDWAARLPDYLWLGLVLISGERNNKIRELRVALDFLAEITETTELALPSLSLIFDLPVAEQLLFYDFLKKRGLISDMYSLSLILPDSPVYFREYLKGYNVSVKSRIDNLNQALKQLLDGQSDLSSDLRYLVVYFAAKTKKLVVNTGLADALNNYLDPLNTPETMLMYRSFIRATETPLMTFASNGQVAESMASNFWTTMGQLTESEGYYIKMEPTKSVDLNSFKAVVYDVLSYYRDLMDAIAKKDEKLFTMLSMATYSYKRLIELVDHNLENTISGRSIVRSLIENFIITKFMLKKEEESPDIWYQYQEYGMGVYKKIVELYKQEQPTGIDNSHFDFQLVQGYVSEFKNEELLDIDTKYFQGNNFKQKFQEVEETDLYTYYYDYDSSFEHGLWGAVRESSILSNDNPGQRYRGIPDIDNYQQLSSVGFDAVMVLKKHLYLLKNQFGLSADLVERLENA